MMRINGTAENVESIPIASFQQYPDVPGVGPVGLDYKPELFVNGSFDEWDYAELEDFMHMTAEEDENQAVTAAFQITLLCLYTVTITAAVGGNVIVCYVVFALQRLRTVTNYFIVSLSCSDVILTAICVPFTVLSNLVFYYWPFGAFLCPLISYLHLASLLQRSLSLVAMTLDRHYAIWKPFRRRLGVAEAKVIIFLMWITSFVISLPTAIFSKIEVFPFDSKGHCVENWSNHAARWYYSINIMLLQYFIPLTVMCITYFHIGVIIWIKRTPGEADTDRDARLAASKRKTVKMLITVVLTYAVCWLPLHVTTIATVVNPKLLEHRYMDIIMVFSHWLAISNSFSNPVIYCWMNLTFRQGFCQVLHCLICRKHRYCSQRPRQRHTIIRLSTRSASSSNHSSCTLYKNRDRKRCRQNMFD